MLFFSFCWAAITIAWLPKINGYINVDVVMYNWRINRLLEMTSDARQKCGNLRYAVTYIVIWANQKTESFEYHWLCALAMFDVMNFPVILSGILSGIGRHFMFCRYVISMCLIKQNTFSAYQLVLLSAVHNMI